MEGRMPSVKSKEKESSSRLALSLSQFGSVKNEFVLAGRIASNNLIQERQFDEAVRVCEMVLAVDPEDVETMDLKERAIVYLHNPDQFDLHEIQRGGSEMSPQRLLRSASERRFRKSDGGALIGTPKSDPTAAANPDKNNNPATEQNGETAAEQGSAVKKLRRTRSEVHRPNVLERIKEFERQAKNTATRPSTRLLEALEKTETSIVIVETPKSPAAVSVSATTSSDSGPVASNRTFIPKRNENVNALPANPGNRNANGDTNGMSLAHSLALAKIPSRRPTPSIKLEPTVSTSSIPISAGFSYLKQRTDAVSILSPVAEDGHKFFRGEESSFRRTGKLIVKWSDFKESANQSFRSEVEANFFRSSLVKKTCIVTLKGETWACYGWNHLRKQEFECLLKGMASQNYLTGSKLRLDGAEFSCLSGTDKIVRARVKKLGVNCTKFSNILVIVVYEHPVLPKEVAMLVRRFGESYARNNA